MCATFYNEHVYWTCDCLNIRQVMFSKKNMGPLQKMFAERDLFFLMEFASVEKQQSTLTTSWLEIAESMSVN